jgi:hypothetical protein
MRTSVNIPIAFMAAASGTIGTSRTAYRTVQLGMPHFGAGL